MPADPFRQLGISRRPSNVIFGTAPVTQRSAPAWSRATIQDAADESLVLEEAQAANDARMAAIRKREAEAKVDQFQQMAPSSRQKFLEDEGPSMTASPRFNEVVQYQKMQPSYADQTLANSVALKITDPEARRVFANAVAAGYGTLAARDMADDHVFKKKQAARLAEAGFSPEEQDEILAKRHDDAHVNFRIAQKKEGTMFHRDPEAQAAEKHYQMLLRQANDEMDESPLYPKKPSPETAAKLKAARDFLDSKYSDKYIPKTPVAPIVPLTSDQAKKQLMGLIKKPAATP